MSDCYSSERALDSLSAQCIQPKVLLKWREGLDVDTSGHNNTQYP
jgi:hypothetical protein